ncbi:MAG: hypothetical protein V2A73_10770 [Pseudomonadota bacterium]
MIDTRLSQGAWACFFEESLAEDVASVPRLEGRIQQAVFLLSPDVLNLTLAMGIWNAVNEEQGTLFDRAEEESLPPATGAAVGRQLRSLAQEQYGGSGPVSARIGEHDGRPWIITLDAEYVRTVLLDLGFFLEHAASRGWTIVASL